MPKPTDKRWYTLTNEADDKPAQLYIHGIIGSYDIAAIDLVAALQAIGTKDIKVHIHTRGGGVYEGVAIHNALKAHKGKTTGVVDGLVASIGTYVLSACDVRQMPSNTSMMIHNPQIGAWGEEEDLEAALQQWKNCRELIAQEYVDRSDGKKTLEDFLEAMKKETWFTAEKALEWGLVDEVIDPVDLTNCFTEDDAKDIAKFKNAPESLLNCLTASNPANEQEDKSEPDPSTPTNLLDNHSTPDNEQVSDMPKPLTPEELQNAVKAENKRQFDIRALCTLHKVSDELTNQMLGDLECSLDKASAKILENLGDQSATGQRKPDANLTASHLRIGNGDHVKEELQNALNARAGVAELDKKNSFGHESLLNMARASLGINAGTGLTKNELVNRAFNSGDFGDIITESIRTVMRDETKVRAPLWRELANVENLSDFRETELVMVNDAPDLMAIGEDGEYKSAILSGSGERIQLATFGRAIQFTRQAIINDEIGLIAKVPRKFMQAGYRLSDKLMFNSILSGKMGDGKSVFQAASSAEKWGNLVANIPANDYAALIMALHKVFATATSVPFGGEKDGGGDALDLRGEFLIAHPDHASMLEAVLNTASKPDSFNPAYKKFNKVIETARLTDVNGAIALTSKDFDSVVMGFLDGQQDPWLETGDGWTSDGAKFRITYDISSKVVDRRGIAKATFE
ncbi:MULTISPECIES: ClpP-like prohead protease/major capsid protein fusion protein [unclassified Vibrio]|uniref:ClpP-like prohead protease/major capsid protein fusion protein n=1 Tax=unclassified Vibrio TaxID=2614977 RepID=UPI000B8ED764|nr:MULTISPECIES: ClpP-like prohead protease/major capsid protein fusion protein [unclassified Vibrio]NAX44241.1 Clp protease ClpP [Vibrio sp. V25_P4S6T154]OXX41852.1 ATP-dependent protease [Vibrio sp. V17_P4S1T151]OXX60711.1 ATP-dependent protease [Vibrio sp. V15_P4S5T153]OXX63227.1 ATP-dependent protease [Vibrio sp. V20_P4S3T152]